MTHWILSISVSHSFSSLSILGLYPFQLTILFQGLWWCIGHSIKCIAVTVKGIVTIGWCAFILFCLVNSSLHRLPWHIFIVTCWIQRLDIIEQFHGARQSPMILYINNGWSFINWKYQFLNWKGDLSKRDILVLSTIHPSVSSAKYYNLN